MFLCLLMSISLRDKIIYTPSSLPCSTAPLFLIRPLTYICKAVILPIPQVQCRLGMFALLSCWLLSGNCSDIVSSHLEKYVVLPFPNSNSGAKCHYPTSLSPLLDENSSYASVARVCLGLSQYASSGCCATCDVCNSPPCCNVVLSSSTSSEASATAFVRG